MDHSVYEHFHPEEHSFVDQVQDWLERSQHDHQIKLTDFLDPRQAYILQSLANRTSGIQIVLSGGYAGAERSRAWIAPDYRMEEDADFEIVVLEIESIDHSFNKLGHGDFLGAILGLGVKREKIGDLHIDNEKCQVVVDQHMADFLNLELRQVGRVQVMTKISDLEQLRPSNDEWEESFISVTSPRCDAVLSQMLRVSRNKVLPLIRNGNVRVNWRIVEDPSWEMKEEDMISVRGYGRYQIFSFEGKSKKGNLRIRIGKLGN